MGCGCWGNSLHPWVATIGDALGPHLPLSGQVGLHPVRIPKGLEKHRLDPAWVWGSGDPTQARLPPPASISPSLPQYSVRPAQLPTGWTHVRSVPACLTLPCGHLWALPGTSIHATPQLPGRPAQQGWGWVYCTPLGHFSTLQACFPVLSLQSPPQIPKPSGLWHLRFQGRVPQSHQKQQEATVRTQGQSPHMGWQLGPLWEGRTVGPTSARLGPHLPGVPGLGGRPDRPGLWGEGSRAARGLGLPSLHPSGRGGSNNYWKGKSCCFLVG